MPANLDKSDAHAAFVAGTPAPATPAATETPAATPVADTGGAAAAGAEAAAAATAAGASGAEAAKAGAEAAEEFIEGRYKGQPFKIPAGVELPRTFKGATTYHPLKKVTTEHLHHQDYNHHKGLIAQREAAFEQREREFKLQQARFEEDRKSLAEEQEQMLQAISDDPDSEEAVKYRRHLENMRDPDYKQKYLDSRELRARKREDIDREAMDLEQTGRSLTQQIASYIEDKVCQSKKYAGKVDPEDLRVAYGQAIQAGQVNFPDSDDPDFEEIVTRQVLRIADGLAARAARLLSPLETQLAEERAKREAAEAAQAAAGSNAETRRQMARSQAGRVTAPNGGAPPSQAATKQPQKPVMGGTPEANERIRAWKRG